MQVEPLPVTDNKKARKHEFHTISTSKNISKEKINFISEFSNESDLKSNLNSNSSKTKKVKNSLNSLLFTTLLPTSIVYPNVLDYICNNTGTKNEGLKKKNSRKNKKFWTTIRKKKISELNIEEDKIISSSLISPNYASPSPLTPKNIGIEELKDKNDNNNATSNKDIPSKSSQSKLEQQSEQSHKKSSQNLYPSQEQQSQQHNNVPTTKISEEQVLIIQENKKSNKARIPDIFLNSSNNNSSEELHKDKQEKTTSSTKELSNTIKSHNRNRSNPVINKSSQSVFKSAQGIKVDSDSVLIDSLPFFSTVGLDDGSVRKKDDIRNKTVNVGSMRKNFCTSVTEIDTSMHANNKKNYTSCSSLSMDNDRKSILYNISPTLTHGELHKKIDSQLSSYSEHFNSLKNTYIITRHNSMDIRKERENKRSSYIKKSNESIHTSNQNLNQSGVYPNPKRISTDRIKHSSLINTNNISINIEADSQDAKNNSFPNIDTIKNLSVSSLKGHDESECMSENSINTITKSNYNNYINESTMKEINKLKDIINDGSEMFFSIDSMDESTSGSKLQSQYFDATTGSQAALIKNGSGSLASLTAFNGKKQKIITESKLKNAASIPDDDISASVDSNEEISVTPKNESKTKLEDIPKSAFSSFEFDDDDNSFNGPLLSLPDSNTNNFSQNYLNNIIKQNNYSSTLNIDEDDFYTPSMERKPTNLEKLQSLFTNDDSSIETKTGSKSECMKNNPSGASLTKATNDYLNTMCDFETWDDDFDGEFSIPDTVVNSQKVLKQEIISFKSFAVNIEDIKTVYNSIYQLKERASIHSNFTIQNSIKDLEEKYNDCIEKYEVLIDLAEQDENDDDSKISTRLPFERYITIRRVAK